MQDPGCRRSGAPRSPQCLHTRLVDRDWGGSWNVDTNSTGHSLCCNASQFLDALPSLALLCPALPCPACVHRGSPRQGRGRSFPAHVCMYACDACSGLKCSSLNLRRSGGPSRDTLPWSETGSVAGVCGRGARRLGWRRLDVGRLASTVRPMNQHATGNQPAGADADADRIAERLGGVHGHVAGNAPLTVCCAYVRVRCRCRCCWLLSMAVNRFCVDRRKHQSPVINCNQSLQRTARADADVIG